VESVRTCDVCKVDIKLSFGGEANWNSHCESRAHRENESKATKSKSLTTWFKKSVAKSNVTASSTPALPTLSSNLPSKSSTSLAITASGSPLADAMTVSDDEVPIFGPDPSVGRPSPTSQSVLFQSLRNCIDTLPTMVQLASKTDILARFSGDPTSEVEDNGDPWETLDPALNIIIGYGASVGEISRIIRRGDYGMDGMYRWLRKCVEELKVDEALLEKKVQRLIDAMILLCVFIASIKMFHSLFH